MIITRYAYVNTRSEAGRGEKVEFDPLEVTSAYCWVNSYGNPSYTLYTDKGFYFLVDDYGAMNDINHISARTVPRKKDLF